MIKINEEDFYSWFSEPNGEYIRVNATIDGMWCTGLYDKKEYQERVEEELPIEPSELLYDLEEADFDNVISCTKDGSVAYGLDAERRFFMELPELASWIDHLRKRGIEI